MIWFIISCVAGLVALFALSIWVSGRNRDREEPEAAATFWIAGIICSVLLGVSSGTAVPTSAIGIETSFGRPVATLDNGFHWVAPWHDVTEIAGAIQTDSYTKDDRDCISVRLGNMSVACIDVTIKWRVRLEAALELFQEYRSDDTFDNIRDSLVTRRLIEELNNQFSLFDPMANIDADTGAVDRDMIGVLAAAAESNLIAAIGGQIEVMDLMILLPHFDEGTQARLDALQQQIGQTRIAEQSQRTAAAQAEANRILAESVSNDPNVLVSRCLDLQNEALNKGQQFDPLGCWPFNGSGVLVNSGP